MALIPTGQPKAALITALFCFVVSLIVISYLRYKVDLNRDSIDRTREVANECGRLRLRMDRREVIQTMGPPIKEYDIRVHGSGSEALYHEMLYKLPPAVAEAPYVDLELESQRVVEIYCGGGKHLVLPEVSRDAMIREAEKSVPTSQ